MSKCNHCIIEEQKKKARQGKTRLIIEPVDDHLELRFSKNRRPHMSLPGVNIPEKCTCVPLFNDPIYNLGA